MMTASSRQALVTSPPDSLATMQPPVMARAFLQRAGWGEAVIVPLAGDASFRRYFRVVDGARHAVLMDAPAPQEDVRPFLAVAATLHAQSLAAPHIIAVDLEAGLVLLQDFGDARLTCLLSGDPVLEPEAYTDAVDILAALHDWQPDAHLANGYPLAPYDAAALLKEVRLFVDWYLPAVTGTVPHADSIAAYEAAWQETLSPVLAQTQAAPVLVLRDYHADNLMWRAEGTGLQRLGLLDFQDALAGHPAYDLVSLLQDARRDVSPALEAQMRAHYLRQRPARVAGIEADDFGAAYAVLGVQRNLKIVGIFTRLWRRDGKPAYLALLDRVWTHVTQGLTHPALAPVAAWMDAHVPPEQRAPASRHLAAVQGGL